jgi:aromatic ring hydroxylase
LIIKPLLPFFVSGEIPTPRYGHVFIQHPVSKEKAIIIGGLTNEDSGCSQYHPHDCLVILDTITVTWKNVLLTESDKAHLKRAYFQALLYKNRFKISQPS